ncbi:MAG: ACP S-malonyltransferase [Victivallaceae bacterium]|nr:ACP S-malonyltransferase [Victivallaceae bacterium]
MKPFFVFSGQGAQTVGMGRDLAGAFPEARALFDEADDVLGYKLSEVIFEGPADRLTETKYCQCAIYTVSCAALAAFGKRFPEVKPVACAGLSLGEYGALYAAGAFGFADGLRLLAKRSDFMDEACRSTSGAMATALGGDPAAISEVAAACGVDVANFNSPGQIVISGESSKVSAAVTELRSRGMRKVIELKVAGAFHSRLMAEAGRRLAEVLENTLIAMPEIPVWHNFTAAPAADPAAIRAALAAQVAGSVRWEACVRGMVAAGGDTMIEFGPGNVLTGLLRRTLPELAGFNVNSVETLNSITF